jgi:hypothetical protein
MPGTIICLIPDATYREARPKVQEPHLTVASFVRQEYTAEDLLRLRQYANGAARGIGPIPAKANGIGIFDAGQDGFAIVDLIDGMGTFNLRRGLENLFGERRVGFNLDNLRIDYGHGFTPHMTREFVTTDDDFYAEIGADMIDNLTFNFIAIGVWSGGQKWEVAL